MMKHAYIVCAHNEPEILRVLLRLIRDPRNDVFLHVDAESHGLDSEMEKLRAEGSVILLPRHKVRWGALSMVRMELEAFEFVRKHGRYSRYHLLSGVDLPLKSQDYIHNFCDVENPDREFVGVYPAEESFKIPLYTEYRRFFMEWHATRNPFIRKPITVVRQASYYFQRVLRLKRHFPLEIHRGDQWVSLTEKAVDYLLSKKAEILQTFKQVYCPDEMFVLSCLMASPLRERLLKGDGSPNGCMREIDWKSVGTGAAHPHVWTMADWPRLSASTKLFARKFSSQHFDVIRAVESHVINGG